MTLPSRATQAGRRGFRHVVLLRRPLDAQGPAVGEGDAEVEVQPPELVQLPDRGDDLGFGRIVASER